MFDARIIVFSELASHEIVNHQIWRSVFDCYKNAVFRNLPVLVFSTFILDFSPRQIVHPSFEFFSSFLFEVPPP